MKFCPYCLSEPCTCVSTPKDSSESSTSDRSEANRGDELENLIRGIDVNDNSKLEAIINSLPDDKIDTVFEIVNAIRIEQQNNPLLKFKKDQPKQMEFIGNKYKINIALAGNQFGKSFSMAFKIASVATGQDLDARHQPDITRPLEILVVGPTWAKITETLQKDIMTLLRPDQYETKSNGTYINKMVINGPKGAKTKVLFMPSSSEKKQDSQEFEGSRYHYAFVDEGITSDLFRKILVRVGSQKGYYYQAFTRLPETIHLAGHLIDLEQGKGEFKYLLDMGLVNIIRASTVENKYLDDEEKLAMMIGAGTGKDLDLFKKIEPLLAKEDEQSIKEKENILNQMTSTFKARILGIVTKPRGSVFNFRDRVQNKDYNRISMKEMTLIWLEEGVDKGRWDICHDYGQSRPATWILCWTSQKTGTIYVIDEVYATGMSIQESAERCYDLMQKWECYGQVRNIFADKQIRDPGKRDKRTDSQLTIEQQYKAKFMLNGDPCFPPNITWICRQSDKNNKLHTMSVLSEMLEESNPMTPGKPYIRFTYLCVNTSNEFKMLRWSTKVHKQSGAEYEDTDGDDHAIDPLRYMINNKVNYQVWAKRHQKQQDFNELAFAVGASGNPLFLF